MIDIHYGTALKTEHRDEGGEFIVYGSNGPVGKHIDRIVDHPTIIIGRKGSVGAIHYAEFGGWPIDTTYYVQIKNEAKLDLRYLYHFLKQADLERFSIVTAIPGINRDSVYSVKMPLPSSTKEQQRIAAILDKAHGIRRKRHQALGVVNQLIRTCFYEMFGDPIGNTKGWKMERLGKLAQLDRGRSRHRPRDEPHLYGDKYPFIQTGDVTNANGRITTYKQMYSELGLQQSKLWPAGTLCITIAANIAHTAILTFPACFPDSVVGLVPGDDLAIDYVHQWFVATREFIDRLATQVAQKNINLEILNALEIPVPPKSLQERFAKFIEKAHENEDRQRASAEILEELCSSLVSRAFRGEL